MRIRLLGTAAGGGVPQWNCNCVVCRTARATPDRVRPRTQSSVAFSADDRHWFLLNASPDISWQIEAFPPLHAPAGKPRGSAIEGILLTNADLDHTLGLLSLREGDRLFIHATAAVRRSLTEGISIAPLLGKFCGLEWIEPPAEVAVLRYGNGGQSGMSYRVLPLPGKAPRFVNDSGASEQSRHVIGYRILDERTGGRLIFLPDVSRITPQLATLLSQCDALLFDGTFWSENEMLERGVGTLSASEMGHLPVSGDGGSLNALADLKVKHKIYFHINNTNPILLEDSPERAAVVRAGWAVAMDGMELII
jgi:pyrroloquinoline quinone biosynthesis protein B